MSRQLTVLDREAVVATAMAQSGYEETPVNLTKFGAWYGLNGEAWCAMYQSWSNFQALGFSAFPATCSRGFASCLAGYNWFRARGMAVSGGADPQRGWLVFYTFSHVGLVLGINTDGRIHTLEGNTDPAGARDGGRVMEKIRSRSLIKGYGRIDFANTAVPPLTSPGQPRPPAVVIPQTPALVQTLQPGVIAASKGDMAKAMNTLAVDWLHDRLRVILPRWNYAGPAMPTGNGDFDQNTTIGVVYFKSWANAIARMAKQPEPFPVVNGLVGSKTVAFVAYYGAYYQTHPK